MNNFRIGYNLGQDPFAKTVYNSVYTQIENHLLTGFYQVLTVFLSRNSTNLEIVRRKIEPTLRTLTRQDVLDIPLSSRGLMVEVSGRRVSKKSSLYYRHIVFNLD